MGSLGYTLQMPEEEKYLETKAELEARLVTYMGGRAAEEIMCDSVTTGASNDIEMATRIARAMVTQFGMSEEFGLMGVESVENRYLDGRAVTNCGDDTIAKVDEVVKVMLQKAYDTAKEMLLTHRDVLERIAGYLLSLIHIFPLSVLVAIVLMYFSGVTLNLISLSGLALGIGMLVDNSIVVIENIYRLRGLGVSSARAAVMGAKQVAGAIASSTLTTICVFLPIIFVNGMVRELFVDLALTIAYSLVASLLIALTVVPAMSSTTVSYTHLDVYKRQGSG